MADWTLMDPYIKQPIIIRAYGVAIVIKYIVSPACGRKFKPNEELVLSSCLAGSSIVLRLPPFLRHDALHLRIPCGDVVPRGDVHDVSLGL